MVRMGELAASRTKGEELVSLGLGSCVGVALVDRSRCVAGLAHVVLPGPGPEDSPAGKYANRAVPALLHLVTGLGARRTSLEAVLVGGAQMFAAGPDRTLDVGARNELAVRAELERIGVPVVAAATGGAKGRSIRVKIQGPFVTVREAGAAEVELLGPIAPLSQPLPTAPNDSAAAAEVSP
jgi:chemotaxis protein CheD